MTSFRSISDGTITQMLSSCTDHYIEQNRDFNTLKKAMVKGQPDPDILSAFEKKIACLREEHEQSTVLKYQARAIQRQSQNDSLTKMQDAQEAIDDNPQGISEFLQRLMRQKDDANCEKLKLFTNLQKNDKVTKEKIAALNEEIREVKLLIEKTTKKLSDVDARQKQRTIRAKEISDRARIHEQFLDPDSNSLWESQLSPDISSRLANEIRIMRDENARTATRYLERAKQIAPALLIEKIRDNFSGADLASQALQEVCKLLQESQAYNQTIQQYEQTRLDLQKETHSKQNLLDTKQSKLHQTEQALIENKSRYDEKLKEISNAHSEIDHFKDVRTADKNKTLGGILIATLFLTLAGLSLGVWTFIPLSMVISCGVVSFIFSCLTIANGFHWRAASLALAGLNRKLEWLSDDQLWFQQTISQQTNRIDNARLDISALRDELKNLDNTQKDIHSAILECQKLSSTYADRICDVNPDNFKTIHSSAATEIPSVIPRAVTPVSELNMFLGQRSLLANASAPAETNNSAKNGL